MQPLTLFSGIKPYFFETFALDPEVFALEVDLTALDVVVDSKAFFNFACAAVPELVRPPKSVIMIDFDAGSGRDLTLWGTNPTVIICPFFKRRLLGLPLYILPLAVGEGHTSSMT